MRAAIYCRISRDPTGRELGVKRQEADARALCEREGYTIAGLFVDDDRSAYSGKPRPAYVSLCDLVRDGAVDVLVAWHPDRLTRQPRELEDLIDLLDSTSTTVRTVQTGQYDLGTPAGRMSARIVGAVARHESEHKSARLRRKHLELADAGAVSGGGDRPFGYEIDRVTVRDDEADIVRQMADRALAGESLRSICRWLDESDVPTTAGNKWNPHAVRRLLTSARIAGMRSHRGEIVAEAVWPAIVPIETHYRLVAMLNDPARRKNSGGRDRKLLTGLIVCGRCGHAMVSRPRGDKTPTYVCPPGQEGGCGTRILGEPVDDLVTAAVLHRLDSPALTDAMQPSTDDERILADLRGLSERRDELAAMWAAGELGQREWKAAGEALDRRETALETELRAAATASSVLDVVSDGGIAERWPTLPHDRRRAVLAAVVEAVTIGPAVRGRNRFDDNRVNMTWRA